jgi:hypothetical protein
MQLKQAIGDAVAAALGTPLQAENRPSETDIYEVALIGLGAVPELIQDELDLSDEVIEDWRNWIEDRQEAL